MQYLSAIILYKPKNFSGCHDKKKKKSKACDITVIREYS
jgi:hypothetical protein